MKVRYLALSVFLALMDCISCAWLNRKIFLSLQKQKYLLYFPRRSQVGLDHCTYNFAYLCLDAYFLGRIPLVDHAPFIPMHNYGISRNDKWENYIDLAAVDPREKEADV